MTNTTKGFIVGIGFLLLGTAIGVGGIIVSMRVPQEKREEAAASKEHTHNTANLTDAKDIDAAHMEFANTIAKTEGVLSVEWENPQSLWVEVDLLKLGVPPNEIAKENSDKMAAAGKDILKHGMCVHIYYGKRNELSKSCAE